MDDYKEMVELKITNGVGLITLNRSDHLNAFNLDMIRSINNALMEADGDEKIRAVVFTGAGKAFTAGGDVEGLSKMTDPKEAEMAVRETSSMVKRVYEFRKPVIAAVNGATFGAGVAFMLACDLVIASERATIGFPFTSLGFCPDCGTSYFLYKLLGHNKASEILLFAKTLSAEEAFAYGLVNKVCSVDSYLDEAVKWAENLARGPEFAMTMTKKILRNAENSTFEKHMQMESFGQILACQTDDFVEGMDALINRRNPKFR
jgi:2-(1,2-epoxy-1,2-dihydrophenyl)acetyl-CoA isomerase